MKLFVIVFSAIIAAAIVIGSVLWAIGRVNDWERAKEYGKTRVLAEIQNDEGNPIKEGVDVSRWPDLVELKNLYVLRRARQLVTAGELLAIYENKPFGLPLSEQDRQDRDYLKQQLEKEKRKLEATTTTPTPTPIENAQG